MRLRTTKASRVLGKTGDKCWYCGVDLDIGDPHRWALDHVVPRRLGGTSEESNLVPSCRSCNSSKRDRTLEEFRLYRSFAIMPYFSPEQEAFLAKNKIKLPARPHWTFYGETL